MQPTMAIMQGRSARTTRASVPSSEPFRRRKPRLAPGRLVAEAQRAMAFDIPLPRRVPSGMQLVNVVWVPGLDDYCSVAYAGRRNTGFRLLVRLASDDSLDDELALTGDPHVLVEHRGMTYAVYSGMYLTEPIDGRYWAPSRCRVVRYDGDLRIEVEGVLDGANSAELLLDVAASVRCAGKAVLRG